MWFVKILYSAPPGTQNYITFEANFQKIIKFGDDFGHLMSMFYLPDDEIVNLYIL